MKAKSDVSFTAQLAELPRKVRSVARAARRAVKAAAPAGLREISYRGGPPRSKSAMWKLARYAIGAGKGYAVGIGAFSDHVSVFFPEGGELEDETGLLRGTGKTFRFLTLISPSDAAAPQVRRLIRASFARASTLPATGPTPRARAKPETIDAYLATVAPNRRAALEKLRRTIHAILPRAEECISYAIPAFRIEGGVVAGFLATKEGCSYVPFSGKTLGTLAADLGAYERTKSSLHFDPRRPLPRALVAKLLDARVAEISAKQRPKRKTASDAGRRRGA